MKSQLTRKRIINAVLISTMALGLGVFNSQPAEAQLSRSDFREAARELNLSRSQMQGVAGTMRSFSADIQEILTPEQFEGLQSAREQQQPETQTPQDFQEALNLTETQSAQLATAREEMVAGLQAVLTPEQVEGLMEKAGFNQL